MPFDIPHEIGLHDSSWRSEYGGDIYISDGSHGCVNTPLEAIATIYANIWEGVPVIVY
jgi:lipoprotein-anchoring transpeptidase ErfK/SrfK